MSAGKLNLPFALEYMATRNSPFLYQMEVKQWQTLQRF